ncbi:MAG: PIG-L deacetylase family protein [Dehalococcoidia bacterium]
MFTAMVISPHADDAAAFCGGTLAKFADQGWHVVLVRVTDDCKDSVGLTLEETRRRNTEELHRAAEILGIAEIVELGYETDCLADVSEVALRERFVYLFRKYRPYAVFTFDPFGMYEGNMDHVRVAQAVEEAFWVSCFDLHHPEHFAEGLEPFSVCERWYFGRHLPEANHAEDVSEYMERKVEAVCVHRQMMRNTINQYRLQLRTWGRRMPWLDASMDGDMRPLLALFFQEQANGVAKAFGLPEGRMAEAFRLVRFGDLEELFQGLSEPLPDAQAAPARPGLDRPAGPSPWSPQQLEQIFSVDLNRRIRLMGHHHLCAGAFEELFEFPAFRAGYSELVARLEPSPDLLIESIYGYDIFCYQCSYWSEEEGRCVTGWQNKISKDAAVLAHLGLRTGQVTRLEDLQRLLAERVTPTDLERFCGPGEWKCEFYLLGVCQRGYERLRQRFASPEGGKR